MSTPQILIVGAGIAGLALYRNLSKQGMAPTLIEKSEHWNNVGAGICLPANAMIELKKAGLMEAIMEQAHQVVSVEYALHDGQTLATASLTEAPLNEAPFVALRRPKLMEILQEGLESQVRFGTTVSKIEESGSKVSVQFSNGSSEEFDLVVGADGINSQIRSLAFPNSGVNLFGFTNWRFTVPMDTTDWNPTYYVGNDTAFMIYPLTKDQAYCYGQISDAPKKWLTHDPVDALKSIFETYCEPVQQVLSKLTKNSDVITGELKTVSQTVPVSGRVVLIGDALHGCPPTLQQGVGMAMEDVNLLAELLSQEPLVSVLEKYEELRVSRIQWVVKESNKIIKLAGLGKFWLGRVLRNFIVRKKGPANVTGWRQLLLDRQK